MKLPAKPLLNAVIGAGLLLAAWPLVQTAYGKWNQQELARQWQQEVQQSQQKPNSRSVVRPAKAVVKTSGEASSVLMAAPGPTKELPPWPATKISIPDISMEAYVVNGWDAGALRRGPAHSPSSGLPGEGNCVIAGHRNVYGSHFYRLDELVPGALINVDTPEGRYTYSARSPFIISEADTSVLAQPPAGSPPILTLITCTLPHTPYRIVLQADLLVE